MRLLITSLLLCLSLLSAPALAKTPGEVEVGATLRDVPMLGLTGPAKKFSDFRGKPLLINVWASWCGPCQLEMASLERLARSKGARQFNMIGISTDDYPEAAKGFLKRYQTSFSHFIDARLVLEHMLGADRLPLTVLVDAKGRVLYRHYGALQWDGPDAVNLIGKAFDIKM